jgi:hypothetical protein
MNKTAAANKRFGEIGVEVIARILLRPLTVGDSPNSVQLNPNFAKPPGRCTSVFHSFSLS